MFGVTTRRNLASVGPFVAAMLLLAFALTCFDLAIIKLGCMDRVELCFPQSGRYAAILTKNLVMTVVAFLPAAIVIRTHENSTDRFGVVASMLRWTAAVFVVGAAGWLFVDARPALADHLTRSNFPWFAYGNHDFARFDIQWFAICLLVSGVGLGPLAGAVYALARLAPDRCEILNTSVHSDRQKGNVQ
jgi:hypothetical protein